MLEDQKDIILKNWYDLVRCDMKKVAEKLLEKRAISRKLIENTFSSRERLHNHRLFLFAIQELDPMIFHIFVDSLRDVGEGNLANCLGIKKHAIAFRCASPSHEVLNVEPDFINSHNEINNQTEKLEIDVKVATKFRDSNDYNDTAFYTTRSNRRGVVLVLNNIDFAGSGHNYRNGAQVDQKNVVKLFEKMGLQVYPYINLTTEEMKLKIKDFAKYSPDKVCDICFVVIMSHGEELNNSTIIFGTDGHYVETSWIIKTFNNENCSLFMNKPKIFLFQTCRGGKISTSAGRTETDSVRNFNKRMISDMLISYATFPGCKACRDTIRGSWYIELVCEIFMKHANEKHVESLLKMVDERLSERMSPEGAMQTSGFENYGFKNCFLHPGIYEKNGEIMKFYS